jgi:hypothetical protein
MSQDNLQNRLPRVREDVSGPLFEEGCVWWGTTSVSLESFVEARGLLICSWPENIEQHARAPDEHCTIASTVARRPSDARTSASKARSARRLARSNMQDHAEGAAQNPEDSAFDDTWYTVEEVAKKLKLSENRVREYCKAGHRVSENYPVEGPYIIAHKFGSAWRITRTELERFLGRAEGREVSRRPK